MFDCKKFESQLPSFFWPLAENLFKQGFILTLVGGAVRDFLRTGNAGHDWDIELSHNTLPFSKNLWKDLGKSLSSFGRMSFLPYEVIRLQIDSFQLEFSPPRKEHYRDKARDHSNFDAEFIFNLPFEDAVKRRDFTINSMGIRFKSKKEIEFLDPLHGQRHLSERVLHCAGPDFSKDPVRFLRAHRFANRLKFSFSSELRKNLEMMDLEGITPAYVWSEMKKAADPIQFFSYLVQEKNLELKVPLAPTFTEKLPEIRKVLNDPTKHETWIIALEWVGISSDNWSKYFSLSTQTSQRLARWAKSSRDFQKIFPENFHGEFDEVRVKEDFEKLFDWYFTTRQLLQKHADLPLLKMIEEYLPHWIHLYKFEPIKDVKHIDPPLRAKYQVWNLCQRL
jgi:tRNA nucleotidyltransferase/poly(A) polymerase